MATEVVAATDHAGPHGASGATRAVGAGIPVEISKGVTRVLAPNPGILTGPGTNTYLIGREDVAVIDPGPADPGHIDALLGAVASLSGSLRWVLVTHTHPDHFPAAAALSARTGAETIGFGARDGFVPDRSVGDGFVLHVGGPGGAHLRALHTPGHSSNHLCFLLEDTGVLFSGDHIVDGSTVVIAPPDGDMASYLASLERLRGLHPPISAIAPGHGGVIDDPLARIDWYIAHRKEREAAILEAVARLAPAGSLDIVRAVYDREPESVYPLAACSVRAHLMKLSHEGAVRAVSSKTPQSAPAETPPGADDVVVVATSTYVGSSGETDDEWWELA